MGAKVGIHCSVSSSMMLALINCSYLKLLDRIILGDYRLFANCSHTNY